MDQRAIYDQIAGTRGRVAGPFTVLLHVPEMADRVQHLGAYLRYEASLDRDIAETAVLVTARVKGSNFEHGAHAPLARRAGVPDQVLDAVLTGSSTSPLPDRYRITCDYVRELASSGGVSDDVYQAAMELLGSNGLVELTVLVGYYALLAMTLRAHGVDQDPAADDLRANETDAGS